jgi:DnaK suppressor protein
MQNPTNKSQSRRGASTLDILGARPRNGQINTKWKGEYQKLMQLREDLARRKDHFSEAAREETPVYSLHMGDAGTDQYDQDFALSMVSADQNALYEIEQAINRICTGSYGVCEISGEPIEPERLEAIPWTRFSAKAQQTLEESGHDGRVRFHSLDAVVHLAASDFENDEADESGSE